MKQNSPHQTHPEILALIDKQKNWRMHEKTGIARDWEDVIFRLQGVHTNIVPHSLVTSSDKRLVEGYKNMIMNDAKREWLTEHFKDHITLDQLDKDLKPSKFRHPFIAKMRRCQITDRYLASILRVFTYLQQNKPNEWLEIFHSTTADSKKNSSLPGFSEIERQFLRLVPSYYVKQPLVSRFIDVSVQWRTTLLKNYIPLIDLEIYCQTLDALPTQQMYHHSGLPLQHLLIAAAYRKLISLNRESEKQFEEIADHYTKLAEQSHPHQPSHILSCIFNEQPAISSVDDIKKKWPASSLNPEIASLLNTIISLASQSLPEHSPTSSKAESLTGIDVMRKEQRWGHIRQLWGDLIDSDHPDAGKYLICVESHIHSCDPNNLSIATTLLDLYPYRFSDTSNPRYILMQAYISYVRGQYTQAIKKMTEVFPNLEGVDQALCAMRLGYALFMQNKALSLYYALYAINLMKKLNAPAYLQNLHHHVADCLYELGLDQISTRLHKKVLTNYIQLGQSQSQLHQSQIELTELLFIFKIRYNTTIENLHKPELPLPQKDTGTSLYRAKFQFLEGNLQAAEKIMNEATGMCASPHEASLISYAHAFLVVDLTPEGLKNFIVQMITSSIYTRNKNISSQYLNTGMLPSPHFVSFLKKDPKKDIIEALKEQRGLSSNQAGDLSLWLTEQIRSYNKEKETEPKSSPEGTKDPSPFFTPERKVSSRASTDISRFLMRLLINTPFDKPSQEPTENGDSKYQSQIIELINLAKAKPWTYPYFSITKLPDISETTTIEKIIFCSNCTDQIFGFSLIDTHLLFSAATHISVCGLNEISLLQSLPRDANSSMISGKLTPTFTKEFFALEGAYLAIKKSISYYSDSTREHCLEIMAEHLNSQQNAPGDEGLRIILCLFSPQEILSQSPSLSELRNLIIECCKLIRENSQFQDKQENISILIKYYLRKAKFSDYIPLFRSGFFFTILRNFPYQVNLSQSLKKEFRNWGKYRNALFCLSIIHYFICKAAVTYLRRVSFITEVFLTLNYAFAIRIGPRQYVYQALLSVALIISIPTIIREVLLFHLTLLFANCFSDKNLPTLSQAYQILCADMTIMPLVSKLKQWLAKRKESVSMHHSPCDIFPPHIEKKPREKQEKVAPPPPLTLSASLS